jgi:hypothetical protein
MTVSRPTANLWDKFTKNAEELWDDISVQTKACAKKTENAFDKIVARGTKGQTSEVAMKSIHEKDPIEAVYNSMMERIIAAESTKAPQARQEAAPAPSAEKEKPLAQKPLLKFSVIGTGTEETKSPLALSTPPIKDAAPMPSSLPAVPAPSVNEHIEQALPVIVTSKGFTLYRLPDSHFTPAPYVEPTTAYSAEVISSVAKPSSGLKGRIGNDPFNNGSSALSKFIRIIKLIFGGFLSQPRMRLYLDTVDGGKLNASLREKYSVRVVTERPASGIGSKWLPMMILNSETNENQEVWVNTKSIKTRYAQGSNSPVENMRSAENALTTSKTLATYLKYYLLPNDVERNYIPQEYQSLKYQELKS